MTIKDPEKSRLYKRAHYYKNKAACIARVKEHKLKRRNDWSVFKSTLQCTKCGENHPATLDFHHIEKDPSNKKIHQLTANGAYTKAMQEIREKCVVLCANCHRKLHYEEHKNK